MRKNELDVLAELGAVACGFLDARADDALQSGAGCGGGGGGGRRREDSPLRVSHLKKIWEST